jgi:hypothetical protein
MTNANNNNAVNTEAIRSSKRRQPPKRLHVSVTQKTKIWILPVRKPHISVRLERQAIKDLDVVQVRSENKAKRSRCTYIYGEARMKTS